MITILKNLTLFFDIILLISFLTFAILFYLEITVNYIQYFIIAFSIIALLIKLFYWNQATALKKIVESNSKINFVLLRLSICIFLYITPSYYILQYPKLIISENIISAILFLILCLAFVTLIFEKYLFFFKKNLD
tara:strand:+ start:74 stop:478 length:405 start_codon:yes stop_codon:yes gene_type:complete